jgi:hypothetical protein
MAKGIWQPQGAKMQDMDENDSEALVEDWRLEAEASLPYSVVMGETGGVACLFATLGVDIAGCANGVVGAKCECFSCKYCSSTE